MERSPIALLASGLSASGPDVDPDEITERDGYYYAPGSNAKWRSIRHEDGTPIWQWTCSRCGDTGGATGAALADLYFRAYHWKTDKCTRRKREAT